MCLYVHCTYVKTNTYICAHRHMCTCIYLHMRVCVWISYWFCVSGEFWLLQISSFLKRFDLFILERGEGSKKGWEGNIDQLPLACLQRGTWPATQICALTRNLTSDLLVCGVMPNPLSHTRQGGSRSFSGIFVCTTRHEVSMVPLPTEWVWKVDSNGWWCQNYLET